jgi:biopolymer transport protein TolQ
MAADSFSIFGLIGNASLLVQLIMLILLLASVFSWAFIFQRSYALTKRDQLVENFETDFWSGIDLGKFYNDLSTRTAPLYGQEAIFVAGFKDFSRLRKHGVTDLNAITDSIQRSMRIAATKESEKLDAYLPFLATVQSMSPYIGLFGTVWGIMNSFRELGRVQQATLAMVAPGISEALIATAFGLIAAIPAGIAYNKFALKADQIMAKYDLFIEEFTAILNRKSVNYA